jgi:hypothetical protein
MAETITRNAHHSIPDDSESSTYRYIIVGARSFLPTTSRKATVTALEEVRRGLVQYEDPIRDAALAARNTGK